METSAPKIIRKTISQPTLREKTLRGEVREKDAERDERTNQIVDRKCRERAAKLRERNGIQNAEKPCNSDETQSVLELAPAPAVGMVSGEARKLSVGGQQDIEQAAEDGINKLFQKLGGTSSAADNLDAKISSTNSTSKAELAKPQREQRKQLRKLTKAQQKTQTKKTQVKGSSNGKGSKQPFDLRRITEAKFTFAALLNAANAKISHSEQYDQQSKPYQSIEVNGESEDEAATRPSKKRKLSRAIKKDRSQGNDSGEMRFGYHQCTKRFLSNSCLDTLSP